MRRFLPIPGLAFLLLAGCADEPPPGPDDDDDNATAEIDLDRLVGGVRIEETTSDSGSTFAYVWPWGIYDAPYPGNLLGVVWGPYGLAVTEEEGDCAFLENLGYGFCDPPCGTDEYCSDDDLCEPWPQYRDAGILTVSGLAEPLTITPSEHGYYSVDWTCCPESLFGGGETVELRAEGNETPAFEVTAVAVAPIEPPLDCGLPLGDGGIEITWIPSDIGGTVRWEMIAAPHAGQGPMILCETDDTGSLIVPAALLQRYVALPRYHETYRLSRYQRAAAEVDHGHQISLEVASARRCDL